MLLPHVSREVNSFFGIPVTAYERLLQPYGNGLQQPPLTRLMAQCPCGRYRSPSNSSSVGNTTGVVQPSAGHPKLRSQGKPAGAARSWEGRARGTD